MSFICSVFQSAFFSLLDPTKTAPLGKLSRKTTKMEGCEFHFSHQTSETNFTAIFFTSQTEKKSSLFLKHARGADWVEMLGGTEKSHCNVNSPGNR